MSTENNDMKDWEESFAFWQIAVKIATQQEEES